VQHEHRKKLRDTTLSSRFKRQKVLGCDNSVQTHEATQYKQIDSVPSKTFLKWNIVPISFNRENKIMSGNNGLDSICYQTFAAEGEY
jgi:hypothetical protein